MLHVVPFHEGFFKISPERMYAFRFRTGNPHSSYGLAQKRKILAAAAAAGVSVAFGSPLGGVLFGLEGTSNCFLPLFCDAYLRFSELDAFGGDFDVMWRGFVTSVIAAVALQYVDPFRTSKLVLFQVCLVLFLPCQRSDSLYAQVTSGSDTWLAFELVCMLPAYL